MKRLHYLLLLFTLIFSFAGFQASAQYATRGEAPEYLRNSIYWLTWKKEGDLVEAPNSPGVIIDNQGTSYGQVGNGNYIWVLPGGKLRVKAFLEEVNYSEDKPLLNRLVMYTPGDWNGDGLNHLFGIAGTTAAGQPNGIPYSGIAAIDKASKLEVKVVVERNIGGNNWIEIDYPGLVFADAEALAIGDKKASAERITASILESGAWKPNKDEEIWQLLASRVHTVSGKMDNTYRVERDGSRVDIFSTRERRKFDPELVESGRYRRAAVLFARGARKLQVDLAVQGNTAVAIGLSLPTDYGDALETYGAAGSYINNFDQAGGYLTSQTAYGVGNLNQGNLANRLAVGTMSSEASVYIGNENNVDPETAPAFSPNAKGDDDNVTNSNDENAFGKEGPPKLKINQSDYELKFNVSNKYPQGSGKNVKVYGWMDFNQDGKFSDNINSVPKEKSTFSNTITPQRTNHGVAFTFGNSKDWERLDYKKPLFLRLRATTTDLSGATGSTDFAVDGEVEDHLITLEPEFDFRIV